MRHCPAAPGPGRAPRGSGSGLVYGRIGPKKRRKSVVEVLRRGSQSARGLMAHSEPAIDGDHGTGDVGGVIVQQRGDDMSQLLGSAEAP